MVRGVTLSMAVVLFAAACGEAKPPASSAATAPAQGAGPQAGATGAPAHDAVSEAAASYRIVAVLAPPPLAAPKPGKPPEGALELTIEMTRPDVHVQAEFPLKVTLVPTAGLKLAKSTLGHADALDPAAKGRRWIVPVTGEIAKEKVVATARFAICKESEPAWCVVRNDTVTATVELR